MIDAGCELECYASDVTRTFPVNGEFSEPQRDLYEIVYAANQAATDKLRPGNHWNDPHDAAVKEVTRGLRDLGILQGRLPALIKTGAYRPFFVHKTGHWLGMDVHEERPVTRPTSSSIWVIFYMRCACIRAVGKSV